ncbi:MAG: hypothetical protein OFPI_15240 [Osedax symbiont Rs2]|nr:MAG: hypothetical protein OFPII_25280 [Osedax symbiont Rs1]EPJ52155.1 MAG: hypothetical protein OFPI_15240 [Osedax symbiont Rs2]
MTEEIITNLEGEDEHILYGLDAWTEFLGDKSLPARASSLKRLHHLICSDKSTIQQVEAVIRKDPVLTLYVVREAQLKHNAKNSAVTTILHAVTSLGYEGIDTIVKDIKPMSLNPRNVQQKRFLHAIATSHHAAHQLQAWMHLKNLPLIDESYLAALFYSIGFWSLWLHAPLHMQQIQMRIHEQNHDPVEAESEILGCSMQMISKNLAKTWQLSELTQLSQDHSTSPSFETLTKLHKRALKDPNISGLELRELNHITQQKHFPIKLANWLALHASRSWYSQSTMRNIDLVSDYLNLSKEQTIALIHRYCGNSSRDYFAPGIASPACQLLFIPSPIKPHYKMGTKELAANQLQHPKPEVPMIKNIDLAASDHLYLNINFYQLIDKHLTANEKKSKFEKPTQVLLALLQGLEKGLGIERLALMSISKKNQTLQTIQTIGFAEEDAIKHFKNTYTEDALFADLCSRQCYYIFDENTEHKLSKKIKPATLAIFSSEFMIISIFRVNQPIAAIYLDMHEQPISNFIRERCRHLCYASSHALELL